MTNDPMKQCLREQLLREEVSSKHGRDRFDRIELKSMLAVMDDLRARVAELESAPTDAEIEEWVMSFNNRTTCLVREATDKWLGVRDRAVALMRRAKAAEAQDVGRVDPERVDRDVAVDLLTDALDRAADPGHQGWDFVNLSGEIVDAILRAARGGAT